jgi:glycogen debranching enzyme
MKFAAELLRDPERALRGEWLHADGVGGWAAQTLIGAHTRREHGLLVVKTALGTSPFVLLARFEEALTLRGQRFELSTNEYPGALYPRGFDWLSAFGLDPLPTSVYELPEARLTRTLARVRGRPGLALVYTFDGPGAAELELRPLLAFREIHALQRENDVLRPESRREQDGDVVCAPYPGCPELHLRVSQGEWQPAGVWYRNFEYARERDAGREFREDLFSPGGFRCRLLAERALEVLVWAGPIPAASSARDLIEEEKRRLRVVREGDAFSGDLRQAADALVQSVDGKATIAFGFPPAPISSVELLRTVPGVLFETGRWSEAQDILDDVFQRVVTALEGPARPVANRDVAAQPEAAPAPDADLDLPLWAAVTASRWLQSGGDAHVLRSRWREALFVLVRAYLDGRVPGRTLVPPGLLAGVGPDGRQQLAIDTQALWYNALLLGADLARDSGQATRSSEWNLLAARVRDAVLRSFWSAERGTLARTAGVDASDWTVSPQQLLALALPHALLPRDKALRLLERFVQELLTPLGLRSAAGDASGRVRPALAGEYFEALIRVTGEEGKRVARVWLRDFLEQLERQAQCGIGDVFMPNARQAPTDIPFHAWSTGELLRLALRVGREPVRRR